MGLVDILVNHGNRTHRCSPGTSLLNEKWTSGYGGCVVGDDWCRGGIGVGIGVIARPPSRIHRQCRVVFRCIQILILLLTFIRLLLGLSLLLGQPLSRFLFRFQPVRLLLFFPGTFIIGCFSLLIGRFFFSRCLIGFGLVSFGFFRFGFFRFGLFRLGLFSFGLFRLGLFGFSLISFGLIGLLFSSLFLSRFLLVLLAGLRGIFICFIQILTHRLGGQRFFRLDGIGFSLECLFHRFAIGHRFGDVLGELIHVAGGRFHGLVGLLVIGLAAGHGLQVETFGLQFFDFLLQIFRLFIGGRLKRFLQPVDLFIAIQLLIDLSVQVILQFVLGILDRLFDDFRLLREHLFGFGLVLGQPLFHHGVGHLAGHFFPGFFRQFLDGRRAPGLFQFFLGGLLYLRTGVGAAGEHVAFGDALWRLAGIGGMGGGEQRTEMDLRAR